MYIINIYFFFFTEELIKKKFSTSYLVLYYEKSFVFVFGYNCWQIIFVINTDNKIKSIYQ